MIEISNIKEKCFAMYGGECFALSTHSTCNSRCPFYKPVGCEDWIRREIGEEIWLIPPEEYYATSVKNHM